MKENEELLRDEIIMLKCQMQQVTQYLNDLKGALDNQVSADTTFSQQFYSQQTWVVYLPFYVQDDHSVSVYVDMGTGYKEVHPIITNGGNQLTLDFDMPYTGYVVVDSGADMSVPAYIPPPPITSDNCGIVLYDRPIEPIVPPEEIKLVINEEFLEEPVTNCGLEEYVESLGPKTSEQRLATAMNGI